MSPDARDEVERLSASIMWPIQCRVDRYGEKVNDDSASMMSVSILEVARNVSILTDEVREMVKMQREAMDMAKAMLEKFADKLP